MTIPELESAIMLFVIFPQLLKLCGAIRNFACFTDALPLDFVLSFLLETTQNPSAVITLKGQHNLTQCKRSRSTTQSSRKSYWDRASLGKKDRATRGKEAAAKPSAPVVPEKRTRVFE